MRALVLAVLVLAGLLAGYAGYEGTGRNHAEPQTLAANNGNEISMTGRSAIADVPDQGELINYDRDVAPIRRDAATWHAVNVSEEHALNGIAKGGIDIEAPDGSPVRLAFDRSIEHADGNWSWIGHRAGDGVRGDAVITFGEKAVFGSLPGNADEQLQITTVNGRTWLVRSDMLRLVEPQAEDDVVVLNEAAIPSRRGMAMTASASPREAASLATPTAMANPTVDVLLGYTPAFATRLGGASQAVTRLNHLVEVANQAYFNSQVPGRIRLVHAMPVNYSNTSSNLNALFALTGVTCTQSNSGNRWVPERGYNCAAATVPSGLQPLVVAREQYGADLVALVRAYEGTQGSCGVGWMLGAGQGAIDSNNASFGYSVVSDTNGVPVGTVSCREEYLAHELGHNMGLQHNRTVARGADDTNGDGNLLDPEEFGHLPYAFGYNSTEAGTGNFYDIMSARSGTGYRVFSNPRINCGSTPCGVADHADNARALSTTMPLVAQFRNAVLPEQNLDLYSIRKAGGASGVTEMHVLAQRDDYQSFLLNQATALTSTGTDYLWRYQLADYNDDGVLDLYSIFRGGASSTTEVHVLNGADRFRSFLLHTATALLPTGNENDWIFRIGNYNRDGRPDVYVIARNGETGTEVHVLDGATNFRSYLAHIATPMPRSGTDGSWEFLLGDYTRDGTLDIYVILRSNTGSGMTEVHVADGATNFNTFALHTTTALPATGVGNEWNFKLGDSNGDGALDMFVILKNGGASARTEVHVLDGASGFKIFSRHIATVLGATGSDNAWEFELGGYR